MTRNPRAALYCRSSKDRSDVSIDVQRRELRKLAADRGLIIVVEYTDVVESGKDEDRPGFQRLLADMKAPDRAWDTLLMLDTGRLARRRLTSIIFEDRDAKRYGIAIVYKNLPDLEAAESMLLRNQLQGLDEYHSLISKRKGLAGMAENVRRGFRAGGRAPRGYELKRIPTGAWREGEEVTKSTLTPSADAPLITRYLQARAAGRARRSLCRELALAWTESSLIEMERNALTYAGHTVWNVRNEFERTKGYKTGRKRRPRAEWIVQRDTHPALIDQAAADTLLTQLETSPRAHRRRTRATYLLSGLLQTPAGDAWHGNGAGRYRAKQTRRNVAQGDVEGAVIGQLVADLRAPAFLRRLVAEARRTAGRYQTDPTTALRPQLADVVARISRTLDLAGELADPAPALRKIEELERRRNTLIAEITRLEGHYQAADALHRITEISLEKQLTALAAEFQTTHREHTKDLLTALVDRIVLDPDTLDCRIHYQIPVTARDKLASPREGRVIPIIRIISTLKVA